MARYIRGLLGDKFLRICSLVTPIRDVNSLEMYVIGFHNSGIMHIRDGVNNYIVEMIKYCNISFSRNVEM